MIMENLDARFILTASFMRLHQMQVSYEGHTEPDWGRHLIVKPCKVEAGLDEIKSLLMDYAEGLYEKMFSRDMNFGKWWLSFSYVKVMKDQPSLISPASHFTHFVWRCTTEKR